jgi:hypothetical protein
VDLDLALLLDAKLKAPCTGTEVLGRSVVLAAVRVVAGCLLHALAKVIAEL